MARLHPEVHPIQAIRVVAAAIPAATAPVLDRFDSDPFWGVHDTVVQPPIISRETLLRLLAGRSKNRGVVYTEARNRLETDGVPFDHDGFAIRV